MDKYNKGIAVLDELKENPEIGIEKTIEKLFDIFVPSCGQSDCLGGELIRAIYKIEYRFYNDGDTIGVGYGNETCNAPARFIKIFGNEYAKDIIGTMWGHLWNSNYSRYIELLKDAVLEQIIDNPELLKTETEDMLSFSQESDYDYKEEDEYMYD